MFNPSKLLLATAHVLVIGALAATIARAIWFFALGPEPAHFVESARPATSSRLGTIDIEQIAALNLFGTPESATGGTDVNIEATPDTKLDLKLFGIFLAKRAGASVAIIGSRGDAGQAYSVGDTIFGNAKVAEVRKDVVLISRAGTMEALRFDDEPTLTANRRPRAAFEELVSASGQTLATSQVDVEMGDASSARMDETIKRFRDLLEKDPDETLRTVGLEAVSVDGDTGYRIGQRVASGQLGRTGLQPGDTIISINGQRIGAALQSAAFADLLSKDSARIEIQRGERRFFITTSLSTLVILASTDRQST